MNSNKHAIHQYQVSSIFCQPNLGPCHYIKLKLKFEIPSHSLTAYMFTKIWETLSPQKYIVINTILFTLYNNWLLNFRLKQSTAMATNSPTTIHFWVMPPLLHLQLQERDLLDLEDPICYTKSSLWVHMSWLLRGMTGKRGKSGTKTNKSELVSKSNWDDGEHIFSPIGLSKNLK